MKKAALLFVFLFFFFAGSFAQYYTNQNKVWAFGFGAGIDFTSGTPVPFVSSMATHEGCASVCDTSGNLLFYSNGKHVYNRIGGIMPSGDTIVTFHTHSTTQAAVIVPVIGNPTQYYLFSLEHQGTSGSRLAYSIIDMTLDSGMGDVVTTSMGIPVDSMLSEKMTVVLGNSCNVWLLTHRVNARQFLAYSITASGISSPVVSTFPTSGSYENVIGCMACSPNRRRIVTQCETSTPNGTELYDFDPATGIIFNRMVLDSTRFHFGAEFSPDNTKLYSNYDNVLGMSGGSVLYQYDITLPTDSAIIASKVVIATGGTGNVSHLRIGPDGKIYLNRFSDLHSNYLDVINYPNLPGASCGYVSHAVALSPGTYGFLGLPSLYVTPGALDTIHTNSDTLVCVRSEVDSCTLIAPPGSDYLWYDGSTSPTKTVHFGGYFWVAYTVGCTRIYDTIHANFQYYPEAITGPSDVCVAHSVTFNNPTPGGVWGTSNTTIATVGAGTGQVTGVSTGVATINYLGISGCNETKNITVLAPPCITAINEATQNNFIVEIFPNPANRECTIAFYGTMHPLTNVNVSDVAGKIIHTYQLNGIQTTISVSSLPPGLYLLKIENGDDFVCKKLVVMR